MSHYNFISLTTVPCTEYPRLVIWQFVDRILFFTICVENFIYKFVVNYERKLKLNVMFTVQSCVEVLLPHHFEYQVSN